MVNYIMCFSDVSRNQKHKLPAQQLQTMEQEGLKKMQTAQIATFNV